MKRRHKRINIVTIIIGAILIFLIGGVGLVMSKNGVFESSTARGPIEWGSPIVVNDIPQFADAGIDARLINPGQFGSQYARLLKLKDGDWLAVYTIYQNNGYLADPSGGTELQVARSKDGLKTWKILTTITDAGRDLDNGEMIQLADGDILLACRSVRWQESYELPVYKSKDMGNTWEYLSMIDENSGSPGELGNPDKGVYEPHLYMLDDGSVSVMYANEKHVVETPSYSQIISQKISNDLGKTWGKEIYAAWDSEKPQSRPGMPVWTKMINGKYIVVFEVCGTESCNIFYKISDDGKTWTSGIGNRIEGQTGGPYILALTDGRLVVTSNAHHISISEDNAKTWFLEENSPFGSLFEGEENVWPCLYQISNDEIAAVTSTSRKSSGGGGNNISIRFGTWKSKNLQWK